MTRKDYISMAKALNEAGRRALAGGWDTFPLVDVACQLANVLAADNPRFDHSKFMAACGLPEHS